MRAVNLLPPDHVTAKKPSAVGRVLPNPWHVAGGAALFFTIVGLALTVWNAGTTVSAKQQQLQALDAQLAKLPAPAAVPTGAAAAAESGRITAVTTLADARLPWDSFLNVVSRVMPENTWLTGLQATTPGAAATVAAAAAPAPTTSTPGTTTTTPATPAAPGTPTSGTFVITGYTYSQPSVALVLRRLSLVPWLSGLTLVSSTQTTLGTTNVVQFSINATVVAQPGGAS